MTNRAQRQPGKNSLPTPYEGHADFRMVSAMRGMLRSVAVFTVVVTACSSGGTPATTPTSVTTTTTSTTVPPSSSTTTTEATTTTVDRLAEIEAIFQDLEEQRLQALYDGDREAFRALFANDEYMERSMALFDLVEFVAPPHPDLVEVRTVLYEGDHCLAAEVVTAYEGILAAGGTDSKDVVLEYVGSEWGISFVGEGWVCDGPHPLSS